MTVARLTGAAYNNFIRSFGFRSIPTTRQPHSFFMIYRAIEGESIPVVPEALIDDPLVSVDDVVSALLYIEENGKLGKHYRLLPPASQLSQA